MIFACCDEDRLGAVRAHGTLNGIDFVEVIRDAATPPSYALEVHFVKSVAGKLPTLDQARIEGGDRIRGLRVTTIAQGGAPEIAHLELSGPGDFSRYTLRLVASADSNAPPSGIDPILASIEFSFEGVFGCGSDFDCAPLEVCATGEESIPPIDYLAKDYASFRKLLLDRMATTLPGWGERSPADLGVTLIELFAYVGDYLSYRQDAVATEAYLGTARRRTSIRRHARLVDYFMHDGQNARLWVHVQVNADVIGNNATGPVIPRGTQVFTGVTDEPLLVPPGSDAYKAVLKQAPVVFETMEDVHALHVAQNELAFYTWGAKECCLPAGATCATLRGDPVLQGGDSPFGLASGDILIFEEVLSPTTGRPEDADPRHRHAVRLIEVKPGEDPLGGRFEADPSDAAVPIVEITWSAADALPFPLCISARSGDKYFDRVSVARGNIVLADHGQTIHDEPLGDVPESTLFRAPRRASPCEEQTPRPVPPRFRPTLALRPLTHTTEVVVKTANPSTGEIAFAPAAAAFTRSMNDALPAIHLSGIRPDASVILFQPRRDLLGSNPNAPEFVVETESDGTASLRFGDDTFGLRPDAGTSFKATYRVGNGAQGNVGATSLAHIALDLQQIIGVSNPLPAQGGVDPESIEEVRTNAPQAFRVQKRAVTAEDYAAVARQHPSVQRAAATFRWTGSWRTVFISVDLFGGGELDPKLKAELTALLEPYRMAGHDIEIEPPRYVPLEIEMHVCVLPGYFRSDVARALLDILSSRDLPGGRRGAFHPDNFTFGQPVYLSPLYAAAQAVEGVASATVTKFQRQRAPGEIDLKDGRLDVDPLEIARLDNDPNFPERGVFRLTLDGGK